MSTAKKCPNCGACKECGAPPTAIPYPIPFHPVPAPYRPVPAPYHPWPHWHPYGAYWSVMPPQGTPNTTFINCATSVIQ